MTLSTLAPAILGFIGAGGLAYVFLYPLLSGEKRTEKRHQAIAGTQVAKTARTDRSATARREQIAQSLKELEEREAARNKVTIENRITQAGLDWSLTKFYVASAIAGVSLGLLLFVVSQNLIVTGLAVFAGGFGLPRWVLGYLKGRRIKAYLDELPNALDIVVRGIRSGLPVSDCMRIIATEAREPVKSEFKFLLDQQTLGIPLPEAAGKLYERVPVQEANFFSIVLGIQAKSGGNLSEALNNLSRVLRERKKMKGKIQAMSMEAKASAGIIAALPFIVALLTWLSSPNYIGLLFTTLVGKVMLVISAFWMLMGCLVMKKMINFDF